VTKEEIAAKYIPCTCGHVYKIRNIIAPDCNLCQEYWAEPMEEYAKQEALEFNIWKSKKGYYAQGFTNHTTLDTPCWIRQENQLCFSNPISSNHLYNLYLDHKRLNP